MSIAGRDLLSQARQDAAAYGYTIDDDGVVHTRAGKKTGVRIKRQAARLRAESAEHGKLLWSGPRIGYFLEHYWYAQKIPGTAAQVSP